MPLEEELATFYRELPNLVKDAGKYVLINDSKVVGTFTSYEDALQVGYKTFGLETFLVKQIQAVEQVQLVTRLLDTPCHT
ncbi:MAG: hypothetical protein WBD27_10355 [Pyrinomonadaceae bacterium]